LDVGYWLGSCRYAGVGVRYFQLGDDRLTFDIDSTINPILTRPFFDVTDGQIPGQDTQLVAFPLLRTGNIHIESDSSVVGGECTVDICCARVGVRYKEFCRHGKSPCQHGLSSIGTILS
jgi:hypothetical protein